MTVMGSIGLLAPAGTPTGIIDQIAQATRTIVAEPAFRQMLIEAGIEPTLNSSPEKFRQSLAADIALWAPVVKSLAFEDRLSVPRLRSTTALIGRTPIGPWPLRISCRRKARIRGSSGSRPIGAVYC